MPTDDKVPVSRRPHHLSVASVRSNLLHLCVRGCVSAREQNLGKLGERIKEETAPCSRESTETE